MAADPLEIADLARHALARCGAVRVVCVDGPAAAGKTTLANQLSTVLDDAPVVHLDDLYDGWAQELGDRLAARLEAWLLLPWADGLNGCHPVRDWATDRYVDWADVPAAPLVIIEGCGSASRRVRARASLVVWVEAPQPERLRRGIARDGAALDDHWRTWQLREDAHFAADGTRAAAHIRLDTG